MKLVTALILFSSLTFAWETHHLLTEKCLEKAVSPNEMVVYRPLEETLKNGPKHFKARTPKDLALELQIQKSYAFPPKLGEVKSMRTSVYKVLSLYTDEPDWGLDQNLFEPEQYPELWDADSPYVTQRTGIKSQGFRHLYFPGKFDWLSPLASLQIPQHPVGGGVDRALLYYQLSQDFFTAGEPYWGFRFLAWSLHYIEDLFQPYHTSQTPTKKFIALQWSGFLPSIDITATGENIGYYHLSYERWIENQVLAGSPVLTESLRSSFDPVTFQMNRESILNYIVAYSSKTAPAIALMSYKIFPKFDPKAGKKSEDVVGTPEWNQGIRDTALSSDLLNMTHEAFARMGSVIRMLVEAPLSFHKNRGK